MGLKKEEKYSITWRKPSYIFSHQTWLKFGHSSLWYSFKSHYLSLTFLCYVFVWELTFIQLYLSPTRKQKLILWLVDPVNLMSIWFQQSYLVMPMETWVRLQPVEVSSLIISLWLVMDSPLTFISNSSASLLGFPLKKVALTLIYPIIALLET